MQSGAWPHEESWPNHTSTEVDGWDTAAAATELPVGVATVWTRSSRTTICPRAGHTFTPARFIPHSTMPAYKGKARAGKPTPSNVALSHLSCSQGLRLKAQGSRLKAYFASDDEKTRTLSSEAKTKDGKELIVTVIEVVPHLGAV